MGDSSAIAIVGVACRLPGGVNSAAQLWKVLLEGKCVCDIIPRERWSNEALDIKIPKGGFIDDVWGFDSAFFRFAPSDALISDPQMRHLLETSYEALCDAGIRMEDIKGTDAGVFIASTTFDHLWMTYSDLQKFTMIATFSNTLFAFANRLSFFYDIHGPSLGIDNACAGSFYALDSAVLNLQSGRCSMAMVGASTILLSGQTQRGTDHAVLLSPSGVDRPFDAQADGYVRSEGIAFLVLKPLAQALADGDRVYSVILGTSANHNGSQGFSLMRPAQVGEYEGFVQALKRSNTKPNDVEYVEAHATGTAVGDPIECQAIAQAFADPERDRPLRIGSLKGNIGHPETASGLAALIKCSLMCFHQQFAPTINFSQWNPGVPESCRQLLRVQTQADRFKFHGAGDAKPVTMLINTGGIGGANSAAIIQQHKPLSSAASTNPHLQALGDYVLLPLSAKSASSLARLVHLWKDLFASLKAAAASDGRDRRTQVLRLVAAAACRRDHFAHRAAVQCRVPQIEHGQPHPQQEEDWLEQLIASLETASNPHSNGIKFSQAARLQKARIAMVFSGSGTQYLDMGRRLFAQVGAFRESIENMDRTLKKLSGWSFLERTGMFTSGAASVQPKRLTSEADLEASPLLSTLAIVFTNVGLLLLWRHLGVEPVAVTGHSFGEIPALFAAGHLNLEETVRLALARGELMQAMSEHGRMIAVELSSTKAQQLLVDLQLQGEVEVAAINGAEAVTLSGAKDGILKVSQHCKKHLIVHKVLHVCRAFHSKDVDAMRQKALESFSFLDHPERRAQSLGHSSTCRFISTSHGVDFSGPFDSSYFFASMRQPVEFARASLLLKTLAEVVIEVDAQPVLAKILSKETSLQVIPTLVRFQADDLSIAEALASTYAAGGELNWVRVFGSKPLHADIPLYPWDHKQYCVLTPSILKHFCGIEPQSTAGTGTAGTRLGLPQGQETKNAGHSSDSESPAAYGPSSSNKAPEHKVSDILSDPALRSAERMNLIRPDRSSKSAATAAPVEQTSTMPTPQNQRPILKPATSFKSSVKVTQPELASSSLQAGASSLLAISSFMKALHEVTHVLAENESNKGANKAVKKHLWRLTSETGELLQSVARSHLEEANLNGGRATSDSPHVHWSQSMPKQTLSKDYSNKSMLSLEEPTQGAQAVMTPVREPVRVAPPKLASEPFFASAASVSLDEVLQKIGELLGLSAITLKSEEATTLSDLGWDSLRANQFRLWLENKYGVQEEYSNVKSLNWTVKQLLDSIKLSKSTPAASGQEAGVGLGTVSAPAPIQQRAARSTAEARLLQKLSDLLGVELADMQASLHSPLEAFGWHSLLSGELLSWFEGMDERARASFDVHKTGQLDPTMPVTEALHLLCLPE